MSDALPSAKEAAPGDETQAVRPIRKGDVGICFFIQSIEDIDVQKETVVIQADIGFFMLKDNDKDTDAQDDAADDADGESAEEMAQLENMKEQFKFRQGEWEFDDILRLEYDDLKDGVIGGEVGVTFKVKVDMQYAAFPFDVQTIPMLMYLQESTGEIYSAEHFFEDNAKNYYARGVSIGPSALISEEWTLDSASLVYEDTDPHETLGYHRQAGVFMIMKRKGLGYMKRFVSITVMLSAIAVLPTMMPQMSFNDILAHQVGLLFAVVGFQLLISTILPPTSTLSVLDQYLVMLFLFIFLIMLSVALEARADPEVETMDIDRSNVHFGCTVGAWVVGHLVFAGRVWYLMNLQKITVYSHPEPEPQSVLSITHPTMQRGTARNSTRVSFTEQFSERVLHSKSLNSSKKGS